MAKMLYCAMCSVEQHHVSDFLIRIKVHSDTTFYYGLTAETAHVTLLLTLRAEDR